MILAPSQPQRGSLQITWLRSAANARMKMIHEYAAYIGNKKNGGAAVTAPPPTESRRYLEAGPNEYM